MRSSSRPARRHPSHSHSHRNPSRPPRRFAFMRAPSAMFSTFNIIRASVYSLVFLWSIICLALAAHFQSVLSASDLTRFVPFAIFVSSATLAIILVLSAFSVRSNMNPVSARIELGCLGLMGTLWIALGAFLANSASETASVECFASANDLTPVDGGYSTETYQAQYRVLEAFSLFNAILLLGFLLLLFGLAVKHHSKGHKHVWLSPVTTFDWFHRGSNKDSKLPAPVTAHRSRSQSKPQVAPAPRRHASEKRTQTPQAPHARRPSYTYSRQPQTAYIPERRQPRTRSTDRYRPDYYRRDASPRR
ncbi:hypothetical protein F5148DRAFT_1164561 [Russula earlei]|uniref:Uncharacterized protein n=1 Tax=Russula earlei TaxID=71964 RepID=A0ACC0UKB9_9AGAM|nr:hypothetical protein F5148DRAFT_1164561 [Russula earlei]